MTLTIQRIQLNHNQYKETAETALSFNQRLLADIDATEMMLPRVQAQPDMRVASVASMNINHIDETLDLHPANDPIATLQNRKQELMAQLAAGITTDSSDWLPIDAEAAADQQKIEALRAKISVLTTASPIEAEAVNEINPDLTALNDLLFQAKESLSQVKESLETALKESNKLNQKLEDVKLQQTMPDEQQEAECVALEIKVNVLMQAEKCRDQEISEHRANIKFFEQKNKQYQDEINILKSATSRIKEGCQNMVTQATAIENNIQKKIDANLSDQAAIHQQYEQSQQKAYDAQISKSRQTHDHALTSEKTALNSTLNQHVEIAKNHAAQIQTAQQTHIHNLNNVINENIAQVSNSTYWISSNNNYLYSPDWDYLKFDGNSKYAMVWTDGRVSNGQWKLIPCPHKGSNVFKFQCTNDNYYLHSSGHPGLHHDSYNYRDVMTFNASNIANELEICWQLQRSSGENNFYIKSLYSQQYLAVGQKKGNDEHRKFVRSTNTDSMKVWHIERITN